MGKIFTGHGLCAEQRALARTREGVGAASAPTGPVSYLVRPLAAEAEDSAAGAPPTGKDLLLRLGRQSRARGISSMTSRARTDRLPNLFPASSPAFPCRCVAA